MDPCIVDDIYTFASNGSFTYEVGTGTYNFIDRAQYSGDEIQESEDGCIKNFYPFDGTNDMTFEVNEVDSTLTLNGKGAYILWPDMANGIDTIPQPYFAPEQIIYDYTIISENEIQLYIRGYFWHTRFTIERMINN